ncbi:MAG: GMC family oxidoreductase, partial [Shewanella sp.]|nr:GMC family oxidoreductase [Shewanella sp.]
MTNDPMKAGIALGWDHIDASTLNEDKEIETDVVIVGTGAGGGTAAEILSQAGLKVVMLEAGPLKTSSDFDMEERTAYPNLYQQAASMKTADSAVGIFQGRAVGGSTTINWTTSIRTPEETLKYWSAEKSVVGLTTESLTPWFEKAEQRLNIHPWQLPPNPNNQVLATGCDKLNWHYKLINRNVKGCLNLGYCGMGCPVNAKQSMLVTTVPAALENGATLISRAKAVKLEHSNGKVSQLNVNALDEGLKPSGIKLVIKAKHYVLAAGAIHTPVLLMRSNTPDPYNLLGKRTFLHPALLSGA